MDYIRRMSSGEPDGAIDLQLPEAVRAGVIVEYMLVNGSASAVLTCAAFGLDHQDGSGWEPVNLNGWFAAVGIIVEPGQAGQFGARIPDDISPGAYRLRNGFRLGQRDGRGWSWARGNPPKFEVAATFHVTAPYTGGRTGRDLTRGLVTVAKG